MKKRIISLLMAALMLASLMPVSAFALGDAKVSFTRQPADVTAQYGTDAVFSAEAKANVSADVRYVWIEASKAGDISIGELISGSAGSSDGSFTLENVTYKDNGKQFKCIAYCIYNKLPAAETSNTVTLTVTAAAACDTHKLEKTEYKAATCAAEGNEEYYFCSICGNCYSDAAGLLPVSHADCVLPVSESHTALSHVDASPADCISKAVDEHWYCADCNKYFSDEGVTEVRFSSLESGDKDPTNHTNLQHVAAVAATCNEKGNIEHWYCSGCDKYFSDANGSNEIKKSAVEIQKLTHRYIWTNDEAANAHYQKCELCGDIKSGSTATHSGGTASCIGRAKCSVCGFEYGSVDPNNHLRFELRNVVESTETQKGYSGDKYCADCGAFIEYGVETDYVCRHIGEHHAAVEASCKADGNIEYWECTKCHKCFSDEGMTAEIQLTDAVKAKVSHYIDSSNTIPNSAVYAEGFYGDAVGHCKICKHCGYKFSVSSHTMTDAVPTCVSGDRKCLVCDYSTGAVDPDNHSGETEVRNAYEPSGNAPGYTGDGYCLDCGCKVYSGSYYYTACAGGCKELKLIEGTPRTCYGDGTKNYYVCKVCNNRYLDAGGTSPVTSEDDLIDKCDGHDFHPGLDSLSLKNALELIKALDPESINYEELVNSIKTGNFDVNSLLSRIKISDLDHCSDDKYHWLGCQRCGKTLEDLRDELQSNNININEKFYELSRKTAHTGGKADCSHKAVCTECGDEYGALGTHRYDAVVTAPTCQRGGYTTHTCSGCGASYKDSYTNKTGHIIKQGYCTGCGEKYPNPFYDVSGRSYYYSPVMWAYYNIPQVTNGMDDNHFMPDLECTRAQVVTFLWRAAGKPEPTNMISPFTDVPTKNSGAFYYKAVMWAVENGITNGMTATTFAPEYTVTRAQFVTFLWRCLGSPMPSNMHSKFTDLNSNAFYYKAVLWAAENGVTDGMTATTFAPEAPCTRGQVVTFLFRAFSKGTAM